VEQPEVCKQVIGGVLIKFFGSSWHDTYWWVVYCWKKGARFVWAAYFLV